MVNFRWAKCLQNNSGSLVLTRSGRYVTIRAVDSHCCRMLHEKEKKGVKDILKLMPEQEVHMLAQTVTSNLIITTTVEGT